MENRPKNDLLKLPTDSYPTIDISEGIKDEKFHAFLQENFGDKSKPFINWAKNTNLDNKITPRKLTKLVLLYEGAVDFKLATQAVSLDSEVEKEILNVFENKVIESQTNKNLEINSSDSIKNENFHIVLKEQFGDRADPFINWAKNTNLDGKITPNKLEKLVLLYEGAVQFDLATKAVTLDEEVRNEIINIFEGKPLTNKNVTAQVKDKLEGIKNEDFHIVLKEQFGERAEPFIDWAKNTSLESKITSTKLEKLVLLYDGVTKFDLVVKALSLDPEVKDEISNIFENKKLNEQFKQPLNNKPRM